MADTIDWNVLIRLAVQGAKGSKSELEGVQKAAEGLSREGKNVEKGLEQATRAMNRTQVAAKSATVDYNKFAEGSISLRYANYDVARTMLSVSAGFAAVGTGAVVAAAKYESAFTAVERTTGLAGDSAAGLREELMQLTREIPQSFADISSLASRGAQLGIPAEEIAKFTEVVAQFVATSDTVTLDQAVEAFGRISNLLGDSNFEALGSAITLVGVNAAATEGQIVKTTQELAPFGAAVGLASDEVIALAAAVASLGQPPERARSAFLTLQKVVDGAVSGMNDKLGAFSTLLGMTEQETANLWKQDPGQFIQSFVTALGGVENLTGAFDALGINERRAIQVFQALAADSRNAAGGMSVLSRAFADANKGYTEQTELQRQYALILDDLASKWQILQNAVMEFAAAAGTAILPAMKLIVDAVTQAVQAAAQFIQTPIGQALAQVAAVVVTVVAALTAFRGVTALATASLVGMNYAARALGGAGIINGLKGLAAAMGLVSTSGGIATGALTAVRGALIRLLGATGVGAVLLFVGSALTDLRGTALFAVDAFDFIFNKLKTVLPGFRILTGVLFGLAEVMNYVTGSTVNTGQTIGNVFGGIAQSFITAFKLLGTAFQITLKEFNNWAVGIVKTITPPLRVALAILGNFAQSALRVLSPILKIGDAFGKGFAKGNDAFEGFFNTFIDMSREGAKMLPSLLDGMGSSADDLASKFAGLVPEIEDNNDAMQNWGGTLDSTTEKVRTLVDYASDLSSVFSRAFEIRYSGQSTLDSIATSFQAIRDSSDEAAKSIRSLKADIEGLNSDINIQQRFLGIAQAYGDYDRAQAIQANIAKLQADLADKSAQLSKEQEKNSKTLTGNSAAAIGNRNTIRDLVSQYQAHVSALASSGLSQEELARQTEVLRQDFINQATQLGFNRAELGLYEQSFYDVTTAINGVPRDITVAFNADPALQALNEFAARAKEQMTSLGPDLGSVLGQGLGNSLKSSAESAIFDIRKYLETSQQGTGPLAGGYVFSNPNSRLRLGGGGSGTRNGFAGGGYTGAGGKYEPAGIVHRGEYVVPKHQVNQRTGLPYADAMGRLQRGTTGRTGYAGGGFVSGGSMGANIIERFGPMAQQQLMASLQQIITMDGHVIAEGVNRDNARATNTGAY